MHAIKSLEQARRQFSTQHKCEKHLQRLRWPDGVTIMTKKAAWHSSKLGIDVYHNNDKCTEGNNIEKRYWTAGTGGKRLCKNCKTYNDAGK